MTCTNEYLKRYRKNFSGMLCPCSQPAVDWKYGPVCANCLRLEREALRNETTGHAEPTEGPVVEPFHLAVDYEE